MALWTKSKQTKQRNDTEHQRDLSRIVATLLSVVVILTTKPWLDTSPTAPLLWVGWIAMLVYPWLSWATRQRLWRGVSAAFQPLRRRLASRLLATTLVLGLAASLAPSCKHSHDSENNSSNDDPAIISELPPDTVFYLNDHLGSPVVELDARGNVIRERSYHPYGSVRRSRGRAADPWSYVGNEYDTGSRLAHFHARQLRPRMGGFYSPDPVAVFSPEDVLAEPSRFHPYGYGSGDPINHVDPNGEVWDVVVDGFFVGFDVGVIIGQNVIQGRTDTLDANLGALAADVGCAFLPFATGGGLAVRAANKADNVFITYAAAKRATQAQAKAQQVQAHVQGNAQQAATKRVGRSGGQQRLKEIAQDANTSAADRGWIQQEQNAVARGQRPTIRNPPGKQLAHSRGREAAKGYNHVDSPSNLQDTDLHRTQHRYDKGGRLNKERP